MFVLQKSNVIFRGVAKVVSRQFRVLETVGSSPAASTKRKKICPCGISSFCFIEHGLEGETVQSGLPVDVRDRGRPSA